MTATADAEPLYEGLARYMWFRRRLSRAPAGAALEMHKRLLPPAAGRVGPPGGQDLHDWLWQRAGLSGAPRVLEVGCGFGATTLRWAHTRAGHFVGIGNCRFQIERARAEAVRLRLVGRCDFVQQSYDQPIPGRFDAVIAVETLLHASDLPRSLAKLAQCLLPNGRLLAQEDAAAEPLSDADADAAALRTAWRAQRIWTIDDWRAAADAAGLRVVSTDDLTAQVPLRPEPVLRRAERRLRLLRRVLPSPRAVGAVDAFLGGIALERLYRRGAMRYRCLVLARGE